MIPNDLRERYGLKPGARVALIDYGGVLSIVPAMDDPVEEAAGILKGKRPLTQALLEEQTSPSRRFQNLREGFSMDYGDASPLSRHPPEVLDCVVLIAFDNSNN